MTAKIQLGAIGGLPSTGEADVAYGLACCKEHLQQVQDGSPLVNTVPNNSFILTYFVESNTDC
ncbi:MAG: hypothetical protein ACFB14_17265 [Leptolyngbyaceae cyanobacterium]